MPDMFLLAGVFGVGDVVVLALWLRERRRRKDATAKLDKVRAMLRTPLQRPRGAA